MTTTPKFACAFLLVASIAAPAWADEGDEAPLPRTTLFFDTFDSNYDGVVTQEEFRGGADVFGLLDKDSDGRITTDELGLPTTWKPDPSRARREPARGRGGAAPGRPRGGFLERIREMDANGDGRVESSEWTGRPDAFRRLDANGDGSLDASDLRGAPRPDGTPRPDGPPQPDGPPRPDGMPRQDDPPPPDAARIFERLDANRDGVLGADEIADHPFAKRLDRDGDGQVTRDEAQEAMKNAPRGPGRGPDRGPGQGRGFDPGNLRRFDANGDGKVDADEFPGSAERFRQLDRNGDGVLDQTDRPAPDATPKPPAERPAPPDAK